VSDLATRLAHVRWIGGGSGAGKTTIARRLAVAHGLRVQSSDDTMRDHGRRTDGADLPYLRRFVAMDMDERWVTRTPQEMLDTFHWFRGELFDRIVEDLLAESPDRLMLVEGFRLLPELVAPLLADRAHAVWLLPTAELRAAAFAGRAGAQDFTARTSDPERARRNLLERNRMFTERLRADTERLGLRTIEVDPTAHTEDTAAAVSSALGLEPDPR
jgi:cytidylate kinase